MPQRFCLSLLFVVLVSCTAQPQPIEGITVWQSRGKWTGRAGQQTDPFISSTGLLRLTWEARRLSNSGPPRFRVVVHSDVSGRPLLVAVDRDEAGKDVTYVTEDPRGFFLVVDAENVEWSVEVAEGIAAHR